jgi:uncharacterized phage-like protein YoqJ
MILGVTGHRPQKMYGFKESDPANIFVIEAIRDFLKEREPDKVLTGMALGVDQWAAQWCIALGIPFVAILPVEHPENAWPDNSKAKYLKIMKGASEVLVAPSEGESYGQLLQKRNEMIVDRADIMMGVYGGGPGGTRNCLEYARKQGKEIKIINPGDYYRN